MLVANGNKPYLDTLPQVGLKPTKPPKEAGLRTESPVSEPKAKGTTPAATAAHEPHDDPPISLS